MLAATLCVFVRAPNLGRVKSRLAASVGEPAALAGHIRLVEHLLDRHGTGRQQTVNAEKHHLRR